MERGSIIIGSRGSELALWQANFVLSELKRIKIDAEIKIIKTKGDIEQNLSWDKMEGKGFFTKEIEGALLKKEIDLAVHSHKDLPTDLVPGLIIAAVSEREDPSELLLINKNSVDEKEKFSLKKNAIVGTSSARRKSQMLAWRNDVKLEDLRGNVPTRIQKLRDKKYDAILIANAGISRLEIDLNEFHCEKLDVKEFIPAPAQGVLALQIRESDKELFARLQKLNHPYVSETISVERKVLNLFDGGCQLPLGVHCEKDENEDGETIYKVRAAKADSWDKFPKYIYVQSKKSEGLAEKVVEKIKNIKPCSVFISRDFRKNDFFKNCLEANGYQVFAQSLIEIKQIAMRKFVKTDWIFFSSKNAVKHFFEQKPDVEGTKFGAVGKSTADEIRKFGKRADFIGDSDNTKMTGKKFSALVGSKTVLFPQAKASMKTIQLQLPKKENVKDVVVYETIKHNDSRLPPAGCQLLIFTSPSNVEAFFEKNKISSEQKVIAMGDATANALKKKGVKTNKQPASFDDLGLVQAVMSL
ncbi:MAG: hydroxymethylbilane synthase [Bacteroidetes bacterium]|nr:hydroxymethylbilane synthase [Bacteroidota bacterium]